jgi:hypothetical protein
MIYPRYILTTDQQSVTAAAETAVMPFERKKIKSGMRNPVNKTCLALLVVFAFTLALAENPNPDDYTVNIHISASRLDRGYQQLEVIIDGKKCELESELALNRLLALGDYKAKLVQDEHKTSYDSIQTYEFLFSDKKTRKFSVNGRSE